MAAIGPQEAAELLTAARAAGMTEQQITEACGGYSPENMSRTAARHFGYVVEAATRKQRAARPAPAATRPTTGWSNASRQRRTYGGLGTEVDRGQGYTVYRDERGSDHQIWDES